MIDHDVGVSMTGIYNVKEVSNDFFEEDSIQNGPLLVHAERFSLTREQVSNSGPHCVR